jgi:hypothetical protein
MADLITMLQAAAGQVGGEYQISRSLRFNSADSAYLSRTPASASNRKTFTISFWVKRSALGATQYIAEGGSPDGATTRLMVRFLSTDTLAISNGSSNFFVSSAVYRDVSAWYHIVVAFDTPNATEANRYKIYVNGSQITGTDNYPSINADTGWNMAQAHSIGRSHIDAGSYFNGYITEFYNIDGQALTPSSFGETNETTGVWSPIRYAGSYGTNGFYLNFSDNSGVTSTTLGKDQAGSNNWTPNNFSVTAGAGNDSLVDTPTQYGTDTGAGGQVRGNYATMNPLDKAGSGSTTFSNGNLTIAVGDNANPRGTFYVNSGKWYWEGTVNAGPSVATIGIAESGFYSGNLFETGSTAKGYVYINDGTKRSSLAGSATAYGNSYTTNDVIGVALDMDAGTVKFYKNGTVQNSGTAAYTGLTGNHAPYFQGYGGTATWDVNFGQRPFAYPLSGFKALVTTNLPEPTVVQGDEHFNTVIYTGTGAARTITVGFQPDFVWLKSRVSAVWYHQLYDVIRAPLKALFSNSTDAESTYTDTLTAFTSDGFNLGTDATYNGPVNNNGDTYVSWNWKANGAGVSNGDGTISSTVSVSTTSGFSIVTYTGTGANATVGHGLGVTPTVIIVKRRDTTGNWHIGFDVDGISWNWATDYFLFTTAAKQNNAPSNIFRQDPTSSVFSLGSGGDVNGSSGTFVAYCFAGVEGFSKFGSYTGNASTDGPFVYTGFRPAWVMIKRSSAVNNWVIQDTSRSVYNVSQNNIYADSSGAEASYVSELTDILSNGFKQRGTGISMNGSGSTYIYMAFAENPFKNSLAR